MSARFDHLVVAVGDLDEAATRWRAAGLSATRGGAHPVGTENVLVRGPEPAYVELISAGSDESNPWLDRVRSNRGPISWAIAVDDADVARTALVDAGFAPGAVREGSRTTPEGALVAWRMCDVGPGPYDGALPFLIQWTTPMEPGPADGPIVESLGLTPPDADRVADLLLALGFVSNAHWPRRMFHEVDTRFQITLSPLGDPVDLPEGSSPMSWGDADTPDEPLASLSMTVASGDPATSTCDGVALSTSPDRRRDLRWRTAPGPRAADSGARGR